MINFNKQKKWYQKYHRDETEAFLGTGLITVVFMLAGYGFITLLEKI